MVGNEQSTLMTVWILHAFYQFGIIMTKRKY